MMSISLSSFQMNDSYDLPSEPRLSNALHLSRPIPQSRTKMSQKKRLPPTPPDVASILLSLDDTVPLDGTDRILFLKNSLSSFDCLDPIIDANTNIYPTPQLVEHSSAYVNEDILPSNQSDNDDFYVIPRQENLPICDTYHSLPDGNSSDANQFYAAPPTFARNFVLESNVSFDDSQDISLDTVPDLVNDPSTNNTVYYSYPDHQPITVNIQFAFRE